MPAVNRKTAAWCTALLVIVQTVVGPVAHPMTIATATDHCRQVSRADTAHSDGDCDDCHAVPDDARAGPQHQQPTRHSDCRCACPCGHTPALAMPNLDVITAGAAGGTRRRAQGPGLHSPAARLFPSTELITRPVEALAQAMPS
jgi:hypothetical protein